MCNVKVAASKVPLTVGVNVHTTFGRKKSGEKVAACEEPLVGEVACPMRMWTRIYSL